MIADLIKVSQLGGNQVVCRTHERKVLPAPATRLSTSSLQVQIEATRTRSNTIKCSTTAKQPVRVDVIVKYPLARAFLSSIAQIRQSHIALGC